MAVDAALTRLTDALEPWDAGRALAELHRPPARPLLRRLHARTACARSRRRVDGDEPLRRRPPGAIYGFVVESVKVSVFE